MAVNANDAKLYLVCDSEGYWLHNPKTGADVLLFHDEDEEQPIVQGEFKAARKRAFELYPDADIRA